MPRMSSRTDGTNPRAQGTNPRAQRGTPPAASSGGGVENAGQEVTPQIPMCAAPGCRERAELGGYCGDHRATGMKPLAEVATQIPLANGSAVAVSQPAAGEELRGAESERAVVNPAHGDIAEELEDRLAAEKAFMASAEEAARMDRHDDDCPLRKGKECSCRANLQDLEREVLPQLERRPYRWVDQGLTRDCVMVRVDDGLEVKKQIPDPISAQNPPITITEQLPPRWVCSACAMSIRGTNIDHRCDVAVLAKARSPLALSRTLPADVRFGGAYRLVLWRDRAGEYHLGEEVVVADRVVEQRPIAGPEPYNIIEAAILDAADRNLAP